MKIGVFDSGIGGKLIAQKIAQALPQVTISFHSDPQYFPYGSKSAEFIYNRLVHFTQLFISEGCEIIVIACNSATTNAIHDLRLKFPQVSFVGIEPPLKSVSAMSTTGKVAIMATKATLESARHQQLQQNLEHQVEIYNLVCEGLAEAIEHDPKPTPKTAELLHQYLDEPINRGVDAVGIACTHYPYVLSQMQALYPQVTFYDPADAVVAVVVARVGLTV